MIIFHLKKAVIYMSDNVLTGLRLVSTQIQSWRTCLRAMFRLASALAITPRAAVESICDSGKVSQVVNAFLATTTLNCS